MANVVASLMDKMDDQMLVLMPYNVQVTYEDAREKPR